MRSLKRNKWEKEEIHSKDNLKRQWRQKLKVKAMMSRNKEKEKEQQGHCETKDIKSDLNESAERQI